MKFKTDLTFLLGEITGAVTLLVGMIWKDHPVALCGLAILVSLRFVHTAMKHQLKDETVSKP